MDLLTLLFRLPFMPVRGFIRLGQMIQEQAERELHDPSMARRQLEEAEEARVSGEISDPDLAQVEGEAVGRLIGNAPAGRTTADGEGS
jgi:Gas vesicle protein G